MMSASSSSATVAVEKATSDLLIGPDWTMNIDICDSVNSHHWQAKDVVKAVKRRLQHKNPKVQLLALTLLETMVKNCGDYVHFQIAEKNILGEMVKIVRKKSPRISDLKPLGLRRPKAYDANKQGLRTLKESMVVKADMHVRDKILVLLDSWQEAFGGPGGKHPQYYYAYEELRRSGVIFPQRSQDAALIFTPPATLMVRHPGYGMPSNSARRLDETMATEFESLSLSSLDSMRDVVELLSDMLQAVNPGDKAAVKDEIIVDLVNRCRSFQKKLMQMLTTTGDEELLARGLELNDSLQSLLAKHDAIASGSSLPSQAANLVTKPTTNEVSTSNKRIEVKDSSPGSNVNALAPVASVTRGRYDEDEEEEDDFAQLARRHSKAQPTPGQSTAAGTSETTAMMNNTTATSYDPAASSPVTCTALALLNPPAPERTTKEQDMIDLLSLALSTTSTSPHTHTRFTSDHTMNQVPISPSTQGQPFASQKYPGNQGQVPYNTYVVPWAQPQAQTQTQSQCQPHQQYQSQVQPQFRSQTQFQSQFRIQPQPQFQSQSQNTSQFLAQPHTPVQYQSQSQSQIQSQFRNPPQLQAQSQNHFQPQSQSQAQIQAQSQNHPQPQSQSQAQIQAQSHSQLRPLSQPQYSQYSFGYPPPPWATTPGYLNSQNSLSATNTIFPTPQPSMTVTNTSMQAARPSQLYSSYTSRASNGSTTIGDPRVNPGPRNPCPAGGQKPFIPSYRLFEDLNVLGSADGRLKVTSGTSPSLSGTASQGMVGSRK